MHIYIFGSLCRGEVTPGSDVDLLALVDGKNQFDPDQFSIYSYSRISRLWEQGNPFAWHLFLESKLVFASDGVDFIQRLGAPAKYLDCVRDCEKFFELFLGARDSLMRDRLSITFDLSVIFLSVRNIATCFSLGTSEDPTFSRHSAILLSEQNRIPLSQEAYSIIERARIVTTRACGDAINENEVMKVIPELTAVAEWMRHLVERAKAYG